MEALEIAVSGPIDADVRPPGSKSLTNRALVCAAVASGRSELRGALDSEDTRVMIEAWRSLGISIASHEEGRRLVVDGCGGEIPCRRQEDLFVANSGTTLRFLTAMLAALGGHYRLDGIARMRERPVGDLVDALCRLGADVRGAHRPGFPPLAVDSAGLQGGSVAIRADVSSQFLSGLLMAAPYARQPVEISIEGPVVSRPYIDMTVRVMEAFGVRVEQGGGEARVSTPAFRIAAPTCYQATAFDIEPDASAASYFWAAAAITGGRVLVRDLHQGAVQGDVAFCQCLERMGCRVTDRPDGLEVVGGSLHGIDVDMSAISDTAQTLAAVALFAAGPTTIRGVGHIRHKETDRIGDLARELRKLGAVVEETLDGLIITPGPLRPARVKTYNDHRMAMSLALVGLRQPGIVIEDPQCVDKTYPRFFADLEAIRHEHS